MPPTIGAAIGFITSEPIPDSWVRRNQAGENSAYCHEFRPQTLDSAFDGRRFHIGIRQRSTRLQFMFESLMEIDNHDYARFDSDAEEWS